METTAWTTPDFIHRHPEPILTAAQMPYDASLIFNAGVCKYQGKYLMAFRNDYGASEQQFIDYEVGRGPSPGFRTFIGFAESDDGIHFRVLADRKLEMQDGEIQRVYDPRLTVIDGRLHLCFAVDTRHGVRGGIAVTEDLEKFDIRSMSAPDNRNMVLFPDRFGGKYLRLERPFPMYSQGERFDVWSADSADLVYWGNQKLVLGNERVPFCNGKIGPAAPPVRTPKGYLTTFHAVQFVERPLHSWHAGWRKVYYAGLMLLDLDDPTRVKAVAKRPLIVPETREEREGFRGSVIFPGGMVAEESGEVKIYYGAADTVECLATASMDDLLAFCEA